MKVIIAIDSFKGSLTSREAGEAARQGIQQSHLDWDTDIITIADGGEGMLNVMLEATDGKSITVEAQAFFSCMAWRAIPRALSKLHKRGAKIAEE